MATPIRIGVTTIGRVRGIATCLGIWTIVGIFRASEDLIQLLHWNDVDRFEWGALTAINLFVAYCHAAMTPFVFALGRRFPIERPHRRRRLLLHAAFSLGATHILILVFTIAAVGLGMGGSIATGTWTSVFIASYIGGFHIHILAYWSILGVHHALRYHHLFLDRDEYAARLQVRDYELRRQLAQAHLMALQAQLRPHFLFNTLNAIGALVRSERCRDACDMLARLRQLLRRVVDDGDAQEIPLRQEIEYLELYLSIERVRFGERLSVETTIEDQALRAAVPAMCLQPLVENCIRHGIGQVAGKGRIRVSARRLLGELELEIEDNGPGLSHPRPVGGTGLGLTNTRERLRQLYGERARLLIESDPRVGTRAIIALPYHHVGSEQTCEARACN